MVIFFLVPEPECLNVIFRSLGLDLDGVCNVAKEY